MRTILQVAYPFAKVSDRTAGGAEQILASLDRALVQVGHRSIVVACEGSEVRGELVPIPAPRGAIDGPVFESTYGLVRERLRSILARETIDVVHVHGVDFPRYALALDRPTLATLHMPPSFYPEALLRNPPRDLRMNAVSATQRATCPLPERLLPPIPNGIPLERFGPPGVKENYVVCLGRICPEKGFHLALDAAARAGVGIRLAGQVFPYPSHVRYFEEEIRPRLHHDARFLGAVGGEERRALLRHAQCVIVPSLIPETSSLAAMEALASGTPVVAFRRGALVEVVEDGRTGLLVGDVDEMVEAIRAAPRLDPRDCRSEAERRFSEARMGRDYLALYARLARGED